MCGIFGWSIDRKGVSRSQLCVLGAILGLLNDERGGHSWGHMAFHRSGLNVQKGLGDIADGLDAADIASSYHVMAHTRFASVGAVTKANAHPFTVGDVIGAHNGVIHNHFALNGKYNRSCAVDSEHIFHHLDAKLDLSELDGWGAIEFTRSSEPGSLYIGKFMSGNLSVVGLGNADAPDGVVWSSDGKHLKQALRLAGISSFPYMVDPGMLYAVDQGQLFEVDKSLAVKETPRLNLIRDTRMFTAEDHDPFNEPWTNRGAACFFCDESERDGAELKSFEDVTLCGSCHAHWSTL